MRVISLEAQKLAQWLKEKGLVLSTSFWDVLDAGCRKTPLFEYEFVINDVSWRGAVKLSGSFISAQKAKDFGWPVVSSDESKIWVAEVSMTAIIANKNRIRSKSQWLVPYLIRPEYGASIEYPALKDLDQVWDMFVITAPIMFRSMEKFATRFESEITGPETDERYYYGSLGFIA